LPYYLALLADAHLRADHADAGLEVVEEGRVPRTETNERWWDAELHRLRAELPPGQRRGSGEAEGTLGRALEIARDSKRSRSSCGRLRRSLACGRDRAGTAEARELLSPVYSSFAEGLETPDLAGARALLSRLG